MSVCSIFDRPGVNYTVTEPVCMYMYRFWFEILKRGPQALTVTWVSEYTYFLLEGLIFVYQQTHHRINKNQQWGRKAAS